MRIFLGGSFCNRVSWVGTIAFVHAHSADDSSDHVRCSFGWVVRMRSSTTAGNKAGTAS